jgi:hypothetical protein
LGYYLVFIVCIVGDDNWTVGSTVERRESKKEGSKEEKEGRLDMGQEGEWERKGGGRKGARDTWKEGHCVRSRDGRMDVWEEGIECPKRTLDIEGNQGRSIGRREAE